VEGFADPVSASQDTGVSARNVSLADAVQREATVGARTVRTKHLPSGLQRRYGVQVTTLQPSEVHSLRPVFQEVPSRYAAACIVMLLLGASAQLAVSSNVSDHS
jgi:hypothetical protein